MPTMQLVGRRSSVFTRMPLIFAEQLGVPYEFIPIPDMTLASPDVYAGNPALKLPILRDGADTMFGALNICRVIAERAAGAGNTARIVWPEELRDTVSRNAQELVWHGMAAQVQLVMGTVLGKLPAENLFFVKARAGLVASLDWLDRHVAEARQALPAPRGLSVLEVSLFCLVEHLSFRPTVPLAACPSLVAVAAEYGRQGAAARTAYRFD